MGMRCETQNYIPPAYLQHVVMCANHCGPAGTIVWVPRQDLGRHAVLPAAAHEQLLHEQLSQEQLLQEHGQQEQLLQDISQQQSQEWTDVRRIAAEQVLQSLHLEVPQPVKLMQKRLSELQERHRQEKDCHQTRVQQLHAELRLIQEMQQQLLAQAEGVMDHGLKQERGRLQPQQQQQQQQQQQWHATEPQLLAGTAAPLQQVKQSVWHPMPMQTAWVDCGMVPCQGSPQAYWCTHMGETASANALRGAQIDHSPPSHHSPAPPVCSEAQRPPPTMEGGRGCGGGDQQEPCRGDGCMASASSTPAPAERAVDTMKTQLQALQKEDPETIFVARRINKLGFTAADQLRSYFSMYGAVKTVYVPHTRVKSVRATYWRDRAASLCFVVMASAEATARLLAEGPEHLVGEVMVRVHTFRLHADPPTDAEACGLTGGGGAAAAAAGEARMARERSSSSRGSEFVGHPQRQSAQ